MEVILKTNSSKFNMWFSMWSSMESLSSLPSIYHVLPIELSKSGVVSCPVARGSNSFMFDEANRGDPGKNSRAACEEGRNNSSSRSDAYTFRRQVGRRSAESQTALHVWKKGNLCHSTVSQPSDGWSMQTPNAATDSSVQTSAWALQKDWKYWFGLFSSEYCENVAASEGRALNKA